jgi:hypothetical protein
MPSGVESSSDRMRKDRISAVQLHYNVRTFKSLQACLGECEKFIRQPQYLYTGNKIERFAWMLPREIWGNWILAAIGSEGREQELRITTDPDGGDGVIWDPATTIGWRMEHVLIPPHRQSDNRTTDQKIIQAAQKGGTQYAKGKVLVVLNESGTGERWHPTDVARALPANDFNETWVITPDEFVHRSVTYAATRLELTGGQAPIYKVYINSLFTQWRCRQIQ